MTRAPGSLKVVGLGIKVGWHTAPEVREHIRNADRVMVITHVPLAQAWIASINPRAELLLDSYREGRDRSETYEEMVERILDPVRAGLRVCAVFYGHPGVFVRPSHRAVARARDEGYEARMLPAISAEDCLYAELEVDPLKFGCQRFEATEFLLWPKTVDPRSVLVLWQIGVIGHRKYRATGEYGTEGLRLLSEVLAGIYGPDHEVVIYEAAETPLDESRRDALPIRALPGALVGSKSTLYVPPRPA